MNHTIPDLQIRIHKLDGSVSTFIQDDADKTRQFLDGFQPAEIFNQQKIFLADSNSYTAFSVSQITRIDLESEEHSHLFAEGGLVEAVELSKGEFEVLIHDMTIRDQWKNLGEQDAFVVVFLNAEMADGQQVMLTMEVGAESPQGFYELRDFILSRPALCFRMRSGGVAVLNLANLVRLTFFPGTLQPSANAWAVRSVDLGPLSPSADSMSEVGATPAVNHRQKLTIQRRH